MNEEASGGMTMDNSEIARILQNMIDEAEENLVTLVASMKGYENLANLNQRRADLAEAVQLVEELTEPAQSNRGGGDKPVGYVWTGASGSQYATLEPVIGEAIHKVDYYLYRMPETKPAPADQGEGLTLLDRLDEVAKALSWQPRAGKMIADISTSLRALLASCPQPEAKVVPMAMIYHLDRYSVDDRPTIESAQEIVDQHMPGYTAVTK